MIDSMKEQIEQMVKEGKTIVDICEELDLEWKDVSKFLHSVDKKSWQGAKSVISLRLKSLSKENDPSARENLVKEADKWINYLYADGRRLSQQVDKARKAMDSARKTLDG